MKAPKISLDGAKLQQMLLLHVEKIVLGVVVLAVLWFVYQGASLPGFDPNQTPDKLSQASNSVTGQINDPSHSALIVPKRDPKHPVQALVRQGQEPNDSTAYRLNNPWKTPDYPKATPRVDPRPFPPEKVIVTAFYGPLAMIPNMGDVDPILAVEVAAPEDGQPPQPGVRPQPRQPGRPAGGEGPGPGPGRPRPRGGRGAGILDGGGAEGLGQIPGYGEGLGRPGGMQGMPGTPGARQLPPEAMVGFRASGTEVIAKEAKAVVVMAVVPLEKQLEEFEKAFKDALDYDPERDIPRYILFRIERADVTADPTIDPAQATWTSLSIAKALNEMKLWAGSPNEVVDLNAIDPLILTHPAPPFLQRDLYHALVHPDIPKAQLIGDGAGGIDGQVQPGDTAGPANEEDLTGAGTGNNPAIGGGQNMEGRPGVGVRPGGGPRAPGYGAPPGYGAGRVGRGPGGPGGFSEGGMRGMGGMGGQTGSPEMKLAKYKLIRFTDTTVEPLKKYRYRIKLILEDPNNPYVGDLAPRWDPSRTVALRKPSIQSMSPNVLQRVRTKDAAATPQNPAYLLESDPSEPSEVVELPPANRYFAGKATLGGGSSFPATAERPASPVVLTSQHSANLLTVEWDKNLAVDVPAEKEVYRGSTLNFEKEVEVIHPVQWIIHPIGKYQFKNNSIVLDFAGGNEIPSLESRRSDTKVQEPTEILIIDGLGNLQLLSETDDVDGFRRYLPPKAEEPRANPAGGFGPEVGPGPGGLLDAPRAPPRPGARPKPSGG